jgi:hypothetical protein
MKDLNKRKSHQDFGIAAPQRQTTCTKQMLSVNNQKKRLKTKDSLSNHLKDKFGHLIEVMTPNIT